MKKRIIPILGILIVITSFAFFFTETEKDIRAEDDMMILEEESIALKEEYSTESTQKTVTLSSLFPYQVIKMAESSITLDHSTLNAVVNNSAVDGVSIQGDAGSIIMNKQYLQSLLSQTEDSIIFSLSVNNTTCAVSAKTKGSTIYGTDGLCLIEVKYGNGTMNTTLTDSGGKSVGLSAYYSDADVLRWAMTKSETYEITEKSVSFPDTIKHWSAANVSYLAARGVIYGMTDISFQPQGKVTRGQFITFLSRVSSDDISSYNTGKFSDVTAGKYYFNAVNWGVEKGIVSGRTEMSFAPEALVTREEMAAFCHRYVVATKNELKAVREPVTFVDAGSISAYAVTAVNQCNAASFINGQGGSVFAPKDNATRAESVTIIAGMIFYLISMPH